MNTTLSAFLRATRTGGPAVALTAAPVVLPLGTGQRLAVRRLDGARMRTRDGVFGEYARAWEFPEHFGWNMDAFNDCMGDLDDRVPSRPGPRTGPPGGLLTIVSNAEQLLTEAPDPVFTWFARSQGRYRDEYATPFAGHADRPAGLEFALVLQTAPEQSAAVHRRWTAAGEPPAIVGPEPAGAP